MRQAYRTSWLLLLWLVLPAGARADRYVLIVGVDMKAQKERKKDTFAAEARGIGRAFARYARGMPGKTYRRQLLGARATRRSILGGLRWLSRMGPRDTAFVYFSIHGGGREQAFKMCPVGYDRNRWQETGVSGVELRQAMARLAGPSVLCVSSCQSGWLFRQRGSWGKCLAIVSCRSKETSWLGVMGKAVREALQGKAGKRQGVVRVRDFRNYVLRRMRRLEKGQHPVIKDNPSIHRVALTRPAKARSRR